MLCIFNILRSLGIHEVLNKLSEFRAIGEGKVAWEREGMGCDDVNMGGKRVI